MLHITFGIIIKNSILIVNNVRQLLSMHYHYHARAAVAIVCYTIVVHS